jgi:hypothetical protein
MKFDDVQASMVKDIFPDIFYKDIKKTLVKKFLIKK